MTSAFPAAALVTRCLSGDSAAWRDLHRTLYPTAVAFLRQLGVRGSDLDDVCQEVFLQVFRYLPRFEQRADIRTWLYKICISRMGRLRRKQRVMNTVRSLLGQAPRPQATDGSADLSDGEVRRRVQGAMDRMNPRQREVFVLYEVEGVAGDEIARIVGCPLATVWSRLHYARHEFVRAIEGDVAIPAAAPEQARRSDGAG
jgi:RNA polymerase sigma-70 factor (ECF subfamily)